MYVYWKPLFLLGIVFWITLFSTDVLRRHKIFKSFIPDFNIPEPTHFFASTDKATVDEKKSSISTFLEPTSSDKLSSNLGLTMIIVNLLIFVASIVFCSLARFVTSIVCKHFRKSEVVLTPESKATAPIETYPIGDTIRTPDYPSEEGLIKITSSSNTELKESTDQICQTIFHHPVPLKYDQTLREECSKLRDQLLMVQSNSTKENALLSRKLDLMAKEKRDLTKRLNGAIKENNVAKAQIEEIMEEKKLIQKRLDIVTKDSRLNMKIKKVTLARLEEISATVDDLRIQLEQVTRDKEILQGKLQVLRSEYEKMQERMRMMQIKEANRINEEKTITLELDRAEKDENVVENSNGKTNEDQSTCDSSQSSLNRILSKMLKLIEDNKTGKEMENEAIQCFEKCYEEYAKNNLNDLPTGKESVFLPYVISQTELDMKNIQRKILQLENSMKGFGSGNDHLQEISTSNGDAEGGLETTMNKSTEEAEKLDEKLASFLVKMKNTREDFTFGKSYDEMKLQLLRGALKDKIKILENIKDRAEESSRNGCMSESTTIAEEDLEMSSEETNSSPRLLSNSQAFQRFLKNIGAEATVVTIGDTKLNTECK